MKRLLLISLVSLLFPLVASAYDVEIDGIYYNVVKKAKQATVTSGDNKYTGSVVIPATVDFDGVTCNVIAVGEKAFSYCYYGLTSVTIPNSVTTIGDDAFSYCYDLTSFTIPNGVTTIGDRAFEYCSGLTSVTIGNSVTTIGHDAFYGCNGLTSVTIGNSVTSIGGYAFQSCSGLTTVTIPNSVTTIGEGAFYNCSDLTSVTIPNSVTIIGESAFAYCHNLTTISIGYGINSIYNYAFANCEELTDVYCFAESVPYAYTDVFKNSLIEYATLHVPAASVDLYKAKAPWKDFGNIVSIQIDGEQPADEVTLTANSYSRAYGEANPTFGYTVTEGSIASGTPTISCEATATSPVGTYDIVIAKGTVSNNTVSLVKGTLTITKAPLTVSAGDYTKVEGEDNPTFTPTYSGFKNGETAAVLTKQPTITTTATKTSTAGTYPVTVSGAEAQNYSFNYQNGTLTVTSQSVVQKDNIQFADAKVKAICVANWDTDHDGELSKQEAAAVTSIGTVFSENWEITRFDELQYFTGLTAIDDNAFSICDGLTSITLPNTVTSLGTYAFSGCDGLTSFVIPSSVTTLNDAVFNYCVGLTSIIIPKSVTRMGFNPLNGCSALTSIQVESGNPNFDSRNRCNAIIYGKSDLLVSGCQNTVIPDGIKTIWQYAFGGCEELTSITIPASVTTFGNYAFFGCDNLEEIHSEIIQPSAFNATVFGNTDILTSATLYVPYGTAALYRQTDGWKNFQNIVEQGNSETAEVGEIVDLGLSVRWADRNLGATDMTGTGTYFAWGDTEARTSYDESHYVFNGGNLSQDIIGTEYDAARQVWGGEWRMPTYEEVEELMSRCTWTYTTRNGVNGYLVESPMNGNYIFLPMPGYKEETSTNTSSTYYWTGALSANNKSKAMSLTQNDKNVEDIRQYLGALIRPVYGEISHYVPTPSNIEALTVKDVNVTSANVNIAISGDLIDVALIGFTFGKSPDELTISDSDDANHKVIKDAAGSINLNLTGMDANTTYYVRAYMKKSDGSYVESEMVSFTTLIDMSDFVSLTAKNYTREYGEENPEFEYEVTDGTIASGMPAVSCEATATSPVGTYDIVIAKGTVSNNTVNLVKGTLTITKAPLTVAAHNYTREYGEENPELEFTLSGFKNEDTAKDLLVPPIVATTASSMSSVGTYDIIVSGGEDRNYSFNYVAGTLTIQPKDITTATIVIDNTSYPYIGSAIEPAVSVVCGGTTLVEGTDYSLSYKNNVMAGTATVTATGMDNYTGTATATFTINKALLTVTAEDKSKVYGEVMPELTYQITGFVNNEDAMMLTIQPFIATTATSMSSVGTYDITVSGGEAQNYEFIYIPATLIVTPKDIAEATVTVADSCAYTGFPVCPDVTVLLDSSVLMEGTDYTLTLSENIHTGVASLTIEGVGNYIGSVTKTFVIYANPAFEVFINDVSVTPVVDELLNESAPAEFETEQGVISVDNYYALKGEIVVLIVTPKPSYQISKENISGAELIGNDPDDKKDRRLYRILIPESGKVTLRATFMPLPTIADLLPDEDDNNGASDFGSSESGVNENTDLNEKVIGNVYYCITPDAGGYDAEEGCLVINKAATAASTELPATDRQLPSVSNGFRGLVFFVNAGRGRVKIKAETTGNLLLCVKIAGELVMSMAVEGKTTVTIPYDVSQPSEVLVYAGSAASSRSQAASSTEDALKIYSLEWESEPTAIVSVDTDATGFDVYDMNGRKVRRHTTTLGDLPKGVYIIGGKKVVVRKTVGLK